MPNDTRTTSTRTPLAPMVSTILALMAVGLLTACATTPPDPALLDPAEEALELAEQAGAPVRASLELDEARGYYEEATQALAADDLAAVARWVELAEVQARLAIIRSQGAQAREALAEKRTDYEELRDELRSMFGDEIQVEETP